MTPETLYARSGEVSIAYQVLGDGPIDLVMAPGWIFHLEVVWEQPAFERMMRRFVPHFRVILFDKRGSGLSDRTVGVSTLEERMDDVRAVMEAAGSKQAVVMGWSEGACFAAMFAATYPERTRALVGHAPLAKVERSDDFPIGIPPQFRAAFETYLGEGWGSGLGAHFVVPSLSDDAAFLRWYGRFERMSFSPSEAFALAKVNAAIDIRHILPSIRVPTLVLHQRGDMWVRSAMARDFAERIPGARFVELSGRDHLFWFGDPDETVAEILEFVTGARLGPEVDRVLSTVMFADIVSSTEHAARLGDRRWQELLASYYTLAASEIDRFRGKQVKTIGDAVLATFDGPARAVRCASALVEKTRALGVELRSGLHTGEIELIGDDVGGLAVHISKRVTDQAGPGEVVTSSTVKDLVVGSGISFMDRGVCRLKGVPDDWRLFAVGT